MRRSLSWFEPSQLNAALARAGVDAGFRPRPEAPARPRAPLATPPPSPVTPAPTPEAALASERAPTPEAPPATELGSAPAAAFPTAPDSEAEAKRFPGVAPSSSTVLQGSVPDLELPPGAQLDQRLMLLGAWTKAYLGASRFFVVDHQGLVLIENMPGGGQGAAASDLIAHLGRLSPHLGAAMDDHTAVSIELYIGQMHLIQTVAGGQVFICGCGTMDWPDGPRRDAWRRAFAACFL